MEKIKELNKKPTQAPEEEFEKETPLCLRPGFDFEEFNKEIGVMNLRLKKWVDYFASKV